MKAIYLDPHGERKLTFQQRLRYWVRTTFSREKVESPLERVNRMYEEATELAQAMGLTQDGAKSMVDQVYSRPPGEIPQEIAGLELSLYALADALNYDMRALRDHELERCWANIDKIRRKNTQKPTFE